MTLIELLKNKNIKKVQARTMILNGILDGTYTLEEIKVIKDKKISIILEAIEEISNKGLMNLNVEYLYFAKEFISSKDNSCKREASRIVGNLAKQYPIEVGDCISALLENTKSEGTVVRWGSAYALSRIILLKEYQDTELFEKLVSICDQETENGVKNQYVKALKKIKR